MAMRQIRKSWKTIRWQSRLPAIPRSGISKEIKPSQLSHHNSITLLARGSRRQRKKNQEAQSREEKHRSSLTMTDLSSRCKLAIKLKSLSMSNKLRSHAWSINILTTSRSKETNQEKPDRWAWSVAVHKQTANWSNHQERKLRQRKLRSGTRTNSAAITQSLRLVLMVRNSEEWEQQDRTRPQVS